MEFLYVIEVKVESMGNQGTDYNSHGLVCEERGTSD